MKAKLKVSWDFDKTEIEKGTEVTIIKGMETDAEGVLNAPYGMCYLCELDGVMSYVPAIYLTIIDWENTDWEQRRYEIAKAAMQGMLAHSTRYKPRNPNINWYNAIAEEAIELSNALIKELKKI